MIRGYTDTTRVQQHLGRSFTAEQEAECYRLIEAAEAWIDGRTGRTWLSTSQVVEQQTVLGRFLYLDRRPVASIATVTVRPQMTVGAAPATLTAGDGYELLNADTGLLLMNSAYAGWLATITYTPNVPLDARVGAACTKLAGHWLLPALDGVSGDLKAYSVGQELSVTFRDPADGGAGSVRGVPDDIVTLIDQLREAVFA